jgi:ABC-type multidrug transport system ATPase subunit
MPHALRTQLSAQRSPASGYRLQAVSAEGRTAGFALTPGRDYLLAREKAAAAQRDTAPDAEVLPVGFGRSEISACHALIRIDGDELVVRDLGSTNGTFAADTTTRLDSEARLPLPTTIHLAQEIVSVTVTRPAAPAGEPIQQTRLSLAELAPGESLTIGREASCDLVLDHPAVSRRHCRLERTESAFHLVDEGSLNGTHLEDVPIRGRTLLPRRASIRIGPFALALDGDVLAAAASPGLSLSVRHLDVTVPAEGGGERVILRDVNFRVRPGEFVALIGASGSGKTTLLERLAGVTTGGPRGAVSIGGCAIPEDLPRLSQLVGYVPQQETIHARLTVRQALAHTLALRSAEALTPTEKRERIDGVLRDLQLAGKLESRVDTLSGGERRRVSLAAELLAQPKILFLDEITSGLDASTERSLMQMLRRLADAGTTIVCITHHLENVHLCDRVAVLADSVRTGAVRPGDREAEREETPATFPGDEAAGRLACFAAPAACLAQYGAADFAAVLEAAARDEAHEEPPPADETPAPPRVPTESHAMSAQSRRLPRGRQLRALLARHLDLLLADRRALLLLIGQPLLVGLVLLVAFAGLDPRQYGPGSGSWKIAFLLAVALVWFATAAGAREIVAERAVLAQERRAGLHLSAYLTAKLLSLLAAGTVQAVLLLVFVRLLTFDSAAGALAPLRGLAPLPGALVVLIAAAWAGAASGLLLSALARSARQAVTLVPYLLLPQIILGGALVPTVLDGTMSGALRTTLGALMPANWAYMGLRTQETDLPDFTTAPVGFDAPAGASGGDPWVVAAVNQHGMDWYVDGRSLADAAFWLPPAALLLWGAVAVVLAALLLRRSR